MALSRGSRRLPNSEDSRVMALWVCISPAISKASVDSTKFDTSACQVTTSGPKHIPGTSRSIPIPIETVEDFWTIPGGATRMM